LGKPSDFRKHRSKKREKQGVYRRTGWCKSALSLAENLGGRGKGLLENTTKNPPIQKEKKRKSTWRRGSARNSLVAWSTLPQVGKKVEEEGDWLSMVFQG